jgi:hypothetical protein
LNILDAIERRLAKVPRITLRQTLVLKVAFRRSVSINPPVFFAHAESPTVTTPWEYCPVRLRAFVEGQHRRPTLAK